jgi:hypothetical protein
VWPGYGSQWQGELSGLCGASLKSGPWSSGGGYLHGSLTMIVIVIGKKTWRSVFLVLLCN